MSAATNRRTRAAVGKRVPVALLPSLSARLSLALSPERTNAFLQGDSAAGISATARTVSGARRSLERHRDVHFLGLGLCK